MSAIIEQSIKKAQKLNKIDDPTGALSVLESVLKQFPKNPRILELKEKTKLRALRKIAGPNPPLDVQQKLKLLFEGSKWQELKIASELLLKIHPNSVPVLNMYGVALRELKEFDASAKAHKKALALDPDHAPTLINYGNSLQALGYIMEAIGYFRRGIKINPNISSAYNSLANCLGVFGNDEEVEKYYKIAIEKNPDYDDAKYNLGGMLLQRGDFEKGWSLREYRWKRPDYKPHMDRFDTPQWQGDPVGKLFVWAEQGIGDEIMYSAALPELKSLAQELIVSVDNRSISLFNRSFPGIKFVNRLAPVSDIEYDEHASAMTAFGRLRKSKDDFKRAKPSYIKANPSRVNYFRDKLRCAPHSGEIIGISWHSKAKIGGMFRSIPIVDLVKQLPKDALIVSLQYGDVAAEKAKLVGQLGRDLHVVEEVDNMNNIDDFCALIESCDRIVSIDNSTVHFAGAIGKKCDVLIPFIGDWRWGPQSTNTSYWYPSIRLHWQTELWNWSGALKSLKRVFN